MIWQDVVMTVGSAFFTITLIPTAIDPRTRMPRYKSAPTAFWLGVFAVAQWTLGLRLAPVCEVVCAVCWLSLALREGRPSRARLGPELRRVQDEHRWLESNINRRPR